MGRAVLFCMEEPMKHIFILNPAAGKGDWSGRLRAEIVEEFAANGGSYEIHITRAGGEATSFVRGVCEGAGEEELRFYACGGDGTLCEVVNGAVGHSRASVASVPCGSGNDFVRNFGREESFRRLGRLVQAPARVIDLLRFSGGAYGINMCNVGFDAGVALNMTRFKALPLVSGQMAYNIALLYGLLHKMHSRLRITLESGEVLEDDFLLACVGNGGYCGGGYYSAPLAEVSDGLLDLCAVKKVPRLKLLSLIKAYKAGRHLNIPAFAPYVVYRRCTRVEIISAQPFALCIDGEVTLGTSVAIELAAGALRFAVPEGADKEE